MTTDSNSFTTDFSYQGNLSQGSFAQGDAAEGKHVEGSFVDRRDGIVDGAVPRDLERRQFGNSHDDLSPPAAELGKAIDRYKLMNRRRFITYEEMLSVVTSLGYKKVDQ